MLKQARHRRELEKLNSLNWRLWQGADEIYRQLLERCTPDELTPERVLEFQAEAARIAQLNMRAPGVAQAVSRGRPTEDHDAKVVLEIVERTGKHWKAVADEFERITGVRRTSESCRKLLTAYRKRLRKRPLDC